MAKFTATVEETLRYTRYVEFELPDNLDVDDVLNKAERGVGSAEDIAYKLERLGATIIEHPDNDLCSPNDITAEITDLIE